VFRVLPAKTAILFELKLVRSGPLVFVRRVIALLAHRTRQSHFCSHRRIPSVIPEFPRPRRRPRCVRLHGWRTAALFPWRWG